MSILCARTGFRLALLAVCAAGLGACESRPVAVDGMLEWEDASTPSDAGEAARNVITSKNPDWRRKAVGFLADEDYGGEPQYRGMYDLFGLADPDAGVRAASCRALGDHGGAKDGAAIVPLLADKDAMVRLAAASALCKIELSGEARTNAMDGLIKLLADEDVDVRAKAADALGHFPDERAMRALMDALEDSAFTVVWYAHRSLVACAGKDGKDLGYDARAWGAAMAERKGEVACAYLWKPYYRRPSVVQWGWQPWTLLHDAPPDLAPRAKAIREESSLKRLEAQKAKDDKARDRLTH